MIYAIIIPTMSDVQSKRKEQCYETEQTTPFVFQEKTYKTDDCVVFNFACWYPDFDMENRGYHFVF